MDNLYVKSDCFLFSSFLLRHFNHTTSRKEEIQIICSVASLTNCLAISYFCKRARWYLLFAHTQIRHTQSNTHSHARAMLFSFACCSGLHNIQVTSNRKMKCSVQKIFKLFGLIVGVSGKTFAAPWSVYQHTWYYRNWDLGPTRNWSDWKLRKAQQWQ